MLEFDIRFLHLFITNKFPMENLRKLIRETIELDISIGDEILTGRFKNKKVIVKNIGKDAQNQPDAAEQIAMNMTAFKLPRKGIDDSINNFNIIQTQKEKLETPEEKEEDLENGFEAPAFNTPNAATKTNIYEAEGADGMYGGTIAMQVGLDKVNNPMPATFGKEAEDEFALYNDNIERALKEKPAGPARSGSSPNNKSKNF